MTLRLSLGLLLVVVSACDDGAECDERIALFDRRLGIAASVRADAPRDDLELPRAERALPSEEETRTLPKVELTRDRLRLDGHEVDEAGLAERLAIMRRNWSVLRPDEEYRHAVALYADRAVPMSRIVELAGGPLGGHRVLVMAQAPTHPRASELPACPPSIDDCDALRSLSPDRRATRLGAIHTRAVGTCAPAIRAFESVAGASLEQRVPRLRRQLVAAARSCGCGAMDLDALEYGILLGEGALDPPVIALAVSSTTTAQQGATVEEWARSR